MLDGGRAEGRGSDEEEETEECNGNNGGKGMCVSIWGHCSGEFINILALSLECAHLCVCLSWPNMNVTENYLNKLKSEVIAASVLAT